MNLNIVLLAAGAGTRFKNEGYTDPKPLISVFGRNLIDYTIENVAVEGGNFTFIFQQDVIDKYELNTKIPELVQKYCNPNQVNLVGLNGITEGSVCSALAAQKYFDNYNPTILANSDQYIENFDINDFIGWCQSYDAKGGLVTFTSSDPKWSYCAPFVGNTDCLYQVGFVAEKVPLPSQISNCGLYYYSCGKEMVGYFNKLIKKNIRVNNEFYSSISYNLYIENGKKVVYYPLEDDQRFFGLGVPEDLRKFEKEYKKL
jgi:NDP-sugar pyrophosphorylase family protein